MEEAIAMFSFSEGYPFVIIVMMVRAAHETVKSSFGIFICWLLEFLCRHEQNVKILMSAHYLLFV